MQKFTSWRACSPNSHLPCSAYFRRVRLPQQSGHCVRRFQIEIVAGSVKVCRHNGDKVCAILARESLTQLYAGDLCNCISLVSRLQRAGQKRALWNRLRSELRINTRAAEEDE